MRLKSFENIGEQLHSEQLPNGLTVQILVKKGYSKAYAFFATHYGGADRRFRLGGQWIDTPEGVAHFLEHKMFDTRQGNALTMLSENGASPNAFTSSDITAYHFQCTDHFYDNLRILLQFVSVPYFTQESVDKEQGIIGQEIQMTQDRPGSELYYNMMKCLYRDNPIRYSVAGTVESISQITPQILYDCHKVFYNPSNMVLCVEGDVDPDTIISICLESLPANPGEIPVRDYGPADGKKPYLPRLEKSMQVSQKQFAIGCKGNTLHAGKPFLADSVLADLAIDALFGKSTQFYTKLYEKGLLGNDYSAGFETVAGVGHALISGQSDNPDAVLEAVQTSLKYASENGVDIQVYQRVKKAAYGYILKRLNSFETTCYGLADSYFNGYEELERAAVLENISLDQINNCCRTVFSPDNFAISIINPVAEGGSCT